MKQPKGTSLLKEKSGTLKKASEQKLKYLTEIIEEIKKAKKQGYLLHALMLSSSIIEEVLLPHLTEMVLARLKIINKKAIFTNKVSVRNSLYFALTQDTVLYEKLEKYRKTRNNVVHKIFNYQSIEKLNKEADIGLKYFIDISSDIGDRLSGKAPLPVLTYYAKGWNDAIKKAVETINKKF
jgi:hypothetical protein